MAMILNPYLTFDGVAREAMEFYRSVLGGELSVMTFGDIGAGHGGDEANVMHSQLETDAGFTLMAGDLPPGESAGEGSSISVSLSGDDVDALRGYFAGLAEGGTVVTTLEKQMWGDEFGMLIDRYGVSWLVNIAGSALG